MRSILRKQQIVEDDNCPSGCRDAETVHHFVLECTRTKQILAALGIHLDTVSELEDIFGVARQQCPKEKEKAWDLVITAALWSIWLSRKRMVFDNIEQPFQVVVKQSMETGTLWAHRAKEKEKEAFRKWTVGWPI